MVEITAIIITAMAVSSYVLNVFDVDLTLVVSKYFQINIRNMKLLKKRTFR